VLNPVEYSATDPVYRSRVIFRPLIEHIPELSAVTEGEYKLTIALNSNEAPPLPDLDQKTMFLQDEAKVFPHVPEEPILTLKISIRGDEPKYDELLVKIKELLIEGPPPSEREQDEINMQQASEKAVTKLGDLGTLLRQVASAAAHTAEFMPHLEVKDGTTPPARTLSPNRRVAQPSGSPMAALPSGSGGFGSSSLGAEGVAVAGGQHDRNLALGALTERLAMGLGELASRTEELPDVVAVYFKDCFAVLDPGLAMVELVVQSFRISVSRTQMSGLRHRQRGTRSMHAHSFSQQNSLDIIRVKDYVQIICLKVGFGPGVLTRNIKSKGSASYHKIST